MAVSSRGRGQQGGSEQTLRGDIFREIIIAVVCNAEHRYLEKNHFPVDNETAPMSLVKLSIEITAPFA